MYNSKHGSNVATSRASGSRGKGNKMKNLSVFEARKTSGMYHCASVGGVHYAALGTPTNLTSEVYIVSEDFQNALYTKCRAYPQSELLAKLVSE